jgi:hypothetical protein
LTCKALRQAASQLAGEFSQKWILIQYFSLSWLASCLDGKMLDVLRDEGFLETLITNISREYRSGKVLDEME